MGGIWRIIGTQGVNVGRHGDSHVVAEGQPAALAGQVLEIVLKEAGEINARSGCGRCA